MSGPIDVDSLELLAAAATVGPWDGRATFDPARDTLEQVGQMLAHGSGPTWLVMALTDPRSVVGPDPTRPKHAVIPALTGNGPQAEANAAFVAAARTAVPALIGRVRELEQRLVDLAAARRAWGWACPCPCAACHALAEAIDGDGAS